MAALAVSPSSSNGRGAWERTRHISAGRKDEMDVLSDDDTSSVAGSRRPVRGGRQDMVYVDAARSEAVEHYARRRSLTAQSLTEEQLSLLSTTLTKHFLFHSFDPTKVKRIIDAMTRRELKSGELLYSVGEPSGTFYVVESGGLKIGGDRLVKRGDTLGELALVRQEMHAASVKATTEGCVLWALESGRFRLVLASHTERRAADAVYVLSQVPLFHKGLSRSELTTLSRAVELRVFSQDEEIVIEGEDGNEMFVIRQGSVSFKVAGSIQTEGVLEVGEYFGERALLYGDKRAATVRASSPITECYVISKKVFTQRLGARVHDMMRTNVAKNTLAQTLALAGIVGEEHLEEIAAKSEMRSYKKGGRVATKDDPIDAIFVVMAGQLTWHWKQGTTVGTGGICGDCILEDPKHDTYTESLDASRDGTECVAVPISAFREAGIDVGKTWSKKLATLQTSDTSIVAAESKEEEEVSVRISTPAVVWRVKIDSVDQLEQMRTLGVGSFGRVKLAREPKSGKIIALKILSKALVALTRQFERLRSERELVLTLNNPFILKCFGTFADVDCCYLMLELVSGGELYRRIHGTGEDERPLDPAEALFYAANVILVYEHVHLRNIIYRDLKPENLLIDNEGFLKVVDWGFAKRTERGKLTYTMCGTPEYLSPELLDGRGHDHSADWWALGAVFYECLAGKPPFGYACDDQLLVYKKIAKAEFEPLELDAALGDLASALMRLETHKRLGCGRSGAKEAIDHAAFASIDWEALRAKDPKCAPWTPEIEHDLDLRNYDDIYDDEEEEIEPYDGDADFEFFNETEAHFSNVKSFDPEESMLPEMPVITPKLVPKHYQHNKAVVDDSEAGDAET